MKTCMLLEDENFLARYMEIMLNDLGYSVMVCRDIAHAKITIENLHFDLAVIDGMLPDGSGVEFAKNLDCPVIFCTGIADEKNRKDMWKLGTVYQKPVDSSFNECVRRISK